MDQMSQNSDKAAVLTRGPWAKRAPAWQRPKLARATRANGFGWLSIAKGELFLFISCILKDQHGTLDTGAKVVGSLDRNTTIGFYFDIANQQVPSLLEWGMGKDFVWKTDFDREIVPQKNGFVS